MNPVPGKLERQRQRKEGQGEGLPKREKIEVSFSKFSLFLSIRFGMKLGMSPFFSTSRVFEPSGSLLHSFRAGRKRQIQGILMTCVGWSQMDGGWLTW